MTDHTTTEHTMTGPAAQRGGAARPEHHNRSGTPRCQSGVPAGAADSRTHGQPSPAAKDGSTHGPRERPDRHGDDECEETP
jgi:hypothetical protein